MEKPGFYHYENTLTPVYDKPVIFNDHPFYVLPFVPDVVYNGPPVVTDDGADIEVQSFRFSYNARGTVITKNKLRGANTAVIAVHFWAVDDGVNISTTEPNGALFFCTPEKNKIAHNHIKEIVFPFIESMRGRVRFTGYSMSDGEDELRKKYNRSISNKIENKEPYINAGEKFIGSPLPSAFDLPKDGRALYNYFNSFPGLDAEEYYNAGLRKIPMPISAGAVLRNDDFVIYDAEGYEKLKNYLIGEGITNILLCGYATDMCLKATTAGYENLRNDFNVFIVGDATLATFPANESPACATTAALTFASLTNMVTQVSWIKLIK